MIRFIYPVFVLFIMVSMAPSVQAGVTEIQQFRFGEYIVRNNNAVHTITVNTGGTYSFSPGFIEISPTAQPGIYDLDGMPTNQAIASVVVTQVTPMSGSGPNMPLSAFQVLHPPTTDGTGVARITLGATASTTGTGAPYVDQTMTGQMQIQINF